MRDQVLNNETTLTSLLTYEINKSMSTGQLGELFKIIRIIENTGCDDNLTIELTFLFLLIISPRQSEGLRSWYELLFFVYPHSTVCLHYLHC